MNNMEPEVFDKVYDYAYKQGIKDTIGEPSNLSEQHPNSIEKSTLTPEQQSILSQFSDKQLRQELYRRNKPVKVSKRDKPKCINCKHKVCFTDAVKMQKKGLLTMKFSTFMRNAICLVNEDEYSKGYYRSVRNCTGCGKFEKKEKVR